LKEHGLIANYDDYAGLPVRVLDDARLLMQMEDHSARRRAWANRGGDGKRR
jgi:hypothetical protein